MGVGGDFEENHEMTYLARLKRHPGVPIAAANAEYAEYASNADAADARGAEYAQQRAEWRAALAELEQPPSNP